MIIASPELLTLPQGDLLSRLETNEQGLTAEEAERRLETYGYNEVATRKRRAAVVEFILQFRSPLVLILLFAGIVSIYFGEAVDAAIIFGIILAIAGINMILKFWPT